VNEKFEEWVIEQLDEVIKVDLLDGHEFGNLCTKYAEIEDFDKRENAIYNELKWIEKTKPDIWRTN
jgi:hypothetical protein